MSEMYSMFEMPLDIILRIFRYLNPKDLRNLMLTCKNLNNLVISDNALWKIKCKADLVIFDRSKDRHVNPFWYHRYRISYNWRNGIFRQQVINKSTVNFMPWLNFYKSQCLLLALGSELRCYGVDQKGIPDCRNKRHWKIDVPIVHRRDKRTNDITRFVVKNNILICGNCDGGAAVYEWVNFTRPPRCIRYIQDCHQQGAAEVSAVALIGTDPGYFVTASQHSQEVKIWSTENNNNNRRNNVNECYKEYKFKDAYGAKCLAVDKSEEKLAVGLDSNDRPQVIDIESGHLLVNTEETCNVLEVLRDIHWYNDHTVCYSTHSGSVQFWDTRIGEVVYKQQDIFQAALYCVRTDGENALLTGSAQNARCSLHDIRSARDYVQIYFVQSRSPSPVYCLDFDSSKLIAAADKSVSVLNYDVPMPYSPNQIKNYSFDFNVVKSNGRNLNGRLQALE